MLVRFVNTNSIELHPKVLDFVSNSILLYNNKSLIS